MDLRQYFQKIRTLETILADKFPLIMSLETSDGGKAGVAVEVTREIAAKAIVDGRAVLATDEEKEQYRQAQISALELAKQSEMAKRVQVAIISESDLQRQLPGRTQK